MQRIFTVLVLMLLVFGCVNPISPPQEQPADTLNENEEQYVPPSQDQPAVTTEPAKEYPFKVYFINLGGVNDNSQAVLIKTQNANILVDTGAGNSYNELQEFLAKKDVTSLNLLVTTSSNDDYSGAIRPLLGIYEVGEIWRPKGRSYQDPGYEQFLKEQAAIRPVFPMNPGLSHVYDGMKIQVLSETDPDQSNFAPVIRLDYEQTCVLLTSRLNTGGQRYLINYAKENLGCDILQIPDSGLSESNTQLKLFLDTVNPEAVIVSGGMYDKEYQISEDTGREGTLNIIKLKSLPIFGTYQDTVVVSSDGKDYKIEFDE